MKNREVYYRLFEKPEPQLPNFLPYFIGLLVALTLVVCLFSNVRAQTPPATVLTASYYSVSSLHKEGTWRTSHGRMANGQMFSDTAFTCANRLYPLGTLLRVTDFKSGRSVIVRTTDRIGKRFGKTRIDLSRCAFEKICPLEKGITRVSVEVVNG